MNYRNIIYPHSEYANISAQKEGKLFILPSLLTHSAWLKYKTYNNSTYKRNCGLSG